MSRFEQILGNGAEPGQGTGGSDQDSGQPAIGGQAAGVDSEDIIRIPGMDDIEIESHYLYWQTVLTNAYYLYCPGPGGERIKLRPLHDVLEELCNMGAGLARVEVPAGRGKIIRFKLEQGRIPADKWEEIKVTRLPRYRDQLKWLFSISAFGAVIDEADLSVEFPAEWAADALGKHREEIAALRLAVLQEMAAKERWGGLCFKVGGSGDGAGSDGCSGRVFWLVPCKTPAKDKRTEVTPEEVYLVEAAQAAGLIDPGPEGARVALRWVG